MEQQNTLARNDTYVSTLANALAEGQSLASVPGLIKKICAGEMWRERYVKQTGQTVKFERFRDFVEEYPPEGLQTTIDTLIQLCKTYNDMEAADAIAQAEAGKRGGNNNQAGRNQYTEQQDNIDNINIVHAQETGTGTSTTYTMRRLAKDAPGLHEQVVAGDLSPHAAAIKAGFRKRKFQMSQDPEEAGLYLAERVDREWMEAMLDAFYRKME